METKNTFSKRIFTMQIQFERRFKEKKTKKMWKNEIWDIYALSGKHGPGFYCPIFIFFGHCLTLTHQTKSK